MNNEFSLIESLLMMSEDFNIDQSSLLVKPGDDAALMSALKHPVISTDTQREHVHFNRNWQTPEEIGYKAVVISLSDLAASYAKPVAIYINLGIPKYIDESYIKSVYKGVFKAIKKYHCALGGGNISRSKELSLDLFSVGDSISGVYPHRSKAKVGDGLYTTGPLGMARAGLDLLLKGYSNYQQLINSFKTPSAKFKAANTLMTHHVACVMDISDGLAGDAEHIARASDISIRFIIDEANINKTLKSYCQENNLSPYDMTLAGGEDYELLFSCSNDTFLSIKKSLPDIYKVADCLTFQGKHIINPPEHLFSYNHFQEKLHDRTKD